MTSTPATSNSAEVQAWIGIAAVAAPEVIAFIQSLVALKKKYPAMSTADIQVAVGTITATAIPPSGTPAPWKATGNRGTV